MIQNPDSQQSEIPDTPDVATTTTPVIAETPQSPIASFKYLSITNHDNGIRELKFLNFNAETLEEWYTYEAFLHATIPSNQIVRQLFDSRGGMLPISGTIQKTRLLFNQFPNMPRQRVAMVYTKRQASLLQPGAALLNMLPIIGRMKMRYFVETDYDDAITWLLEEK